RIQSVEERVAANDAAVGTDVQKTRLLLEKAIQEVRRISRNLRPSELDDLGLAAALRRLCDEFVERTGIVVTLFASTIPRNLPGEMELSLYRIVQEALTNVERHARASEVDVSLSRHRALLTATIRDNGRGFDPSRPAARRGQSPG